MLSILYLPGDETLTSLQDDDIVSIRDEQMGWPQVRVFRLEEALTQLEIFQNKLRKKEILFPFAESAHYWKAEKIAELLRIKSKKLKSIPASNPEVHDFRVVPN